MGNVHSSSSVRRSIPLNSEDAEMVNHIPKSAMLFGLLLLLFFQAPMTSAAEPSTPSPSTSSADAVCDVFPSWPGCGITKCQRWKTCGPCTGKSCADWDEDRDGGPNLLIIGEKRTAPTNNVVTPSMQGRTGTEPSSGRLRRDVRPQAPTPAAGSEPRDHRTKSAQTIRQTIRDHRKQSDRTNTIVQAGDAARNTLSDAIPIIDRRPRNVRDHRDVAASQTVLVGSRDWLQPAAIGRIGWDSLDDQFDRTTGKCKIADCRIGEIDINEYIWASKEDVDEMLRIFGLRGFEGDYRICTGCSASERPNSMDVIFDRFTQTRQRWSGDYIYALTRDGDPPDSCDSDEVSTLPDGTEISTGCINQPGLQYGTQIILHRATGEGLDTQDQVDFWNNSLDSSEVEFGPMSDGAWLYKDSLRAL